MVVEGNAWIPDAVSHGTGEYVSGRRAMEEYRAGARERREKRKMEAKSKVIKEILIWAKGMDPDRMRKIACSEKDGKAP